MSLVTLALLWPEFSIGAIDIHDGAYHWPLIAHVADELKAGGNPIDFWVDEWALGYAVPRTYQMLPHLFVALLDVCLLHAVDLHFLFVVVRTLVLAAFPLSLFGAARLFGMRPWTAAACAAVAPLISTQGLYGLDFGSQAWRGSGLFTQSFAMHALPLTLGLAWRSLRSGRGLHWAALALSITSGCHFVYGWMGAAFTTLQSFVPLSGVALPRRLLRLAVLGSLTAVMSLWLVLPLIQDHGLINHSRWEDAWKWNSFGLPRVLELCVSGDLLDHARLPVLSLLSLIGLGVWIYRIARADESALERFLLSGVALSALLFAGRPLWGELLPFLGLGADVPLHRLIGGLHLFLLLAAGEGLATLGLLAARFVRDRVLALASTGLVVALVLAPAVKERVDWLELNTKWGRENLAAWENEAEDIKATIAECAKRGGRALPGLAGWWGREVKTGWTPLYAHFSRERVPAIAFLYHCMGLTTDVMVRFDERIPQDFRVFGVNAIAATDAQSFGPHATETARHGRFRVYETPGGGLFDVVGVPVAIRCDSGNYYDVMTTWLRSDWPRQRLLPWLDLRCPPPSGMAILEASEPLPPLPDAPGGRVLEEGKEARSYRARVRLDAPAFVTFKMSYHPNWRIEVDGVAQRVAHVAPGFMAVPVGAGEHEVRCTYAPGSGRLFALLLLPLGLVFGRVFERRGVLAALEEQVARAASQLTAWWSVRPRLAEALVLAAIALPVVLPWLHGRLNAGHDHWSYLPRFVEFHENLRHGILLPRWAPDLGSGHGQPLFVFAPPLLLAVSAAWQFLGFGLAWSQNLSVVVLVLIAAWGAFRLGQAWFGRMGGFVLAAAWIWSPYFSTNLVVRHALAEFSAFAFFPLVLDGLSRHALARWPLLARPSHALSGLTELPRVKGSGSRSLAGAAVAFACVLLCHPPAALLFAPLAAAFALFLGLRARSFRLASEQAAALALGLGLSAWIWLPALLERGEVKMERLLEGYLRYENHFVHPMQLLWSKWGFGLSLAGQGDGMSFALGLVHAGLGLAALVLLARLRSPRFAIAAFFGSAGIAWALASTTLAKPLWDVLPLLQHVEFPWRLLGPAALCIAVVVAGIVEALPGRSGLVALLVALIVFANLAHAWPQSSEKVNESWLSPSEIARRGLSVLTAEEYEPRAVGTRQPWSAERVAFVEGVGEVLSQDWEPDRARVQVRAATDAMLEFRVYFYPGWTAVVDGREALTQVVKGTGFQRLGLPAGAHDVQLVLRRTGAQRAGLAISMLAFLALGFLAVSAWSASFARTSP